jgi:16S rRNA (guanine(966)-N(2))-methyltransferase RsmD
MDRMRESVFGVLESAGGVGGLSFLDLFSGSGIVALEAASRGAGVIDAVEGDAGKRDVLLGNVAMSPVRIDCHFMPVERFVKRSGGKRVFDVVFCDPPFKYAYKEDLLLRIASAGIVAGGGLVILHRPAGDALNEDELAAVGLTLVDRRQYGRSMVDFRQAKPQTQPQNPT